MKLSILIPTYNEAGNIKRLIEKIVKICKNNYYNYEIIIIDDNSPDKTGLITRKLARNYNIKTFIRAKKEGLGSAYKFGFKKIAKETDLIFMMDADLSHDPDKMPDFVNEINNGYDLVQGSRKIKGGFIESRGLFRHLVSYISFLITLPLMNVKDPNGSYKCFKSEILTNVNLNSTSDGFGFLIELLYLINKRGYKIKELPIKFKNRHYGKSKLTFYEIISNLRLYLKLYYDKFFK